MEKRKRYVKTAAVILLLTMAMLLISTVKVKAQSDPDDPTPGYYETSEYMIGNCSVSLILPESNGTIEDWTTTEEQNVINKTQYALNWWAGQNLNANVSFALNVHLRVPTSYEPINRSSGDIQYWADEIMTSLGYPRVTDGGAWDDQVRDYVNFIRNENNTDWGFVIFVVDSSNDADGRFAIDNKTAFSKTGGPYIVMTYDNGNKNNGIEDMDRICAHEIGHIFWAWDEDAEPNPNPPISWYSGYLNVSIVPQGGGIMDYTKNWNLSGYPHGDNGTWGQVGWRDNDTDTILDIVDTSQNVYINSSTITGNKMQYNGTAAVTFSQNNNTRGSHRNVTINKIQSVQYSIDNNGTWFNANMTPTTIQKHIFFNNSNVDVATYANVSFTFEVDLTTLSPGIHAINISATNQWNISGYATSIFYLNTVISITNVAANKTVISVKVNNTGSSTVNTSVSVAWKHIDPTQNVTLPPGETTLNFVNWETNPTGHYEITAVTDVVIINSSVYIGFYINKTVSFGVGGSQASQSDSTSNWVALAFCMLSASFIAPEFSKKKKPDDDLLTATPEHTDSTENMWQNLARHQLT